MTIPLFAAVPARPTICSEPMFDAKIEAPIKHLEFVSLSKEKALVILITESGIIENRIIKIPKGLPSSVLIEISNYLNSVIKGRTLNESKETISNEIKNDKIRIDKVTKKLIDQGIACWDDASKKNNLIITGTSKLLDDVKAMEQLEDIRVLIEKLYQLSILIFRKYN